jgi:hypothetical protein
MPKQARHRDKWRRFSDILFQKTDGQTAIWYMNGTTIDGGGTSGPIPGELECVWLVTPLALLCPQEGARS